MPSSIVAVTADVPVFEVAIPCEVFGLDRSDIADPWYEFHVVAAGDPHRPIRSPRCAQCLTHRQCLR